MSVITYSGLESRAQNTSYFYRISHLSFFFYWEGRIKGSGPPLVESIQPRFRTWCLRSFSGGAIPCQSVSGIPLMSSHLNEIWHKECHREAKQPDQLRRTNKMWLPGYPLESIGPKCPTSALCTAILKYSVRRNFVITLPFIIQFPWNMELNYILKRKI